MACALLSLLCRNRLVKLWERRVGVEYKEAAGPRAVSGRERLSLHSAWDGTKLGFVQN